MPSELAAFSYNYLVSKYIENYKNTIEKSSKIDKSEKRVPKEMWAYKRTKERGIS